MTNERFNELINGPLHHPMSGFTITRLVLALKAVVQATGVDGEKALEAHCASRQSQDDLGPRSMRRKEKRKDCPHCGLPLRLRKLPPVRRRRDKFWSHVQPGSAAICRDLQRMARHREQK